MQPVRDSSKHLDLLSELVLKSSAEELTTAASISALTSSDLEDLEKLAASNHVVVRAFERLESVCRSSGDEICADWVRSAIKRERARIDHAVAFLHMICSELDQSGCPAIVIKSLDHWPDLGSDLDLYTDAEAPRVVEVMKSAFKAQVAERSWGDRLANKWNFVIPGLRELVEIHIGRLGQTGEQAVATRSLSGRACQKQVGQYVFPVAAPEDRIVISTLQRMYRHFYIRLCDIVDNARLLDERAVDFDYLHSLGVESGLWQGIATYLLIISEYVENYRGYGVPLPRLVTDAARFGTDQVRFRRDFLRVSILPHSMKLYANELKTFLLRGDLRNGFRLSLLPCLATAAALEMKITGSDKGIW
jgi:hypothetical protein